MTRYTIFILLFSCLWCSCEQEEIQTFSVKDSSIYFTKSEVAFSFRNQPNKESGIINLPFKLMGPTVDYDRTVNVMVVDTSSTAGSKAYAIQSAILKANENVGNIALTVTNADSLAATTLTLKVGIDASNDFVEGIPTNRFCLVTWNDMLIKPTSWRSWFYFLCKTYSSEFHQVVLDALGEDAYLLNTWGEKGKDEQGVSYPRTSQDVGIAMSRKLKEYVTQYNAAHPDAPLMHGTDGILYTSYNKVSKAAPNTPIVIVNR